ncbi:response regulator transcription factor (plasmid) [Mycetohabitans endofungorum]|nr:response regulator transcription factor [Mycetohabitans sp. B3]
MWFSATRAGATTLWTTMLCANDRNSNPLQLPRAGQLDAPANVTCLLDDGAAGLTVAVLAQNVGLHARVRTALQEYGIACRPFGDDISLVRAVSRHAFSAVLLDATAGVDPLQPILARRLCYRALLMPVILVSVADDVASSKAVLESGADDIVLAPVNARDLMTRLQLAILRHRRDVHAREGREPVLQRGEYRLDRGACTVSVRDRQVRLTPREFEIAWILFSNEGEYVSREHITRTIWPGSDKRVDGALDQHIYKLRKKLALNGESGWAIQPLYGHGYRVVALDATGPRQAA